MLIQLEGAKVRRWSKAHAIEARELDIKKKADEMMYRTLAQDSLNQTTMNTQATEIFKLGKEKEDPLKRLHELATESDALSAERDSALAKCDAWKTDASEAVTLRADKSKLETEVNKFQAEMNTLRAESSQLKKIVDDLAQKNVDATLEAEERYQEKVKLAFSVAFPIEESETGEDKWPWFEPRLDWADRYLDAKRLGKEEEVGWWKGPKDQDEDVAKGGQDTAAGGDQATTTDEAKAD